MSYDLENLHWREFERLVAFYLKEKIGEGLWTFDGSQDKGRDAVFSGTANDFPSMSSPYTGAWIFQVKHRITRSKTLAEIEQELLRTLGGELDKLFNKHKFKCNNYVFITNINVSNSFRDKASAQFTGFCTRYGLAGINFNVIEYKDLEVFLALRPSVRYSFPALLTFADIESVFLKKEDVKNRGYLEFARRNINRFVSTGHYIEAMRRIRENNFLMLVGNAKVGKTSIIEALSLCFLEEADYKPYFIRNVDELVAIVSYSESKRLLLICDDIFGKHDLDVTKLSEWTDYFQSVMGLIDSNHKFLFTTREYIYKEFADRSGLRSFFPNEKDPTRFVIEVNELSVIEREQILEKHLLSSSLAPSGIQRVLVSKQEILSSKDFSPEVIRSLVGLLSITPIEQYPRAIATHIASPNQYVYEFFERISDQKKLLLLSIAVSPDGDSSDVEKTYLLMLEETRDQPSFIFETFVSELEGSIIKRKEFLNSSELEYYHPSMYEVLVDICRKDKYYRGLMLKNTNLELLTLLSLRTVEKTAESNRFQLMPDEFELVLTGLDRLIPREKTIGNITRIILWISLMSTTDLPYAAIFFSKWKVLKRTVRNRLVTLDFFEAHSTEAAEQWITFLEKLQMIPGEGQIQYARQLERAHRNFDSTNYWRLLFLLDGVSEGLIEHDVEAKYVAYFINTLRRKVMELRAGLNLVKDRPKTNQRWMPRFQGVNALINAMKKSAAGRKWYDQELSSDWNVVMQYSGFAKNRYAGMVSKDYWKPYKRIRDFGSFSEL